MPFMIACSRSSTSARAPRREARLGRLDRARHVGALTDRLTAVADERLGAGQIEFILRGAWKRHLTRHLPRALAGVIFALEVIRVFLDAPPTDLLEVLDPVELLKREAVLVVDEALRVGHRHDLGPQLQRLLDRVDGDIARAGDDARLTLQVRPALLEHVLDEVDAAVPGGLGANQAAAVG